MTDRHEDVTLQCPDCSALIDISKNWTAGGINDYGGWVLKCITCSHVFHHRLGRDVNDSEVNGATILDTYYDESENQDEVLKRYGLS